jgi:hypothetical protein
MPVDTSRIDLTVNAHENTFTAICIAWRLGYCVKIDVHGWGIVHHRRTLESAGGQRIETIALEQLASLSLSKEQGALHDGNRIPTLDEILDAQVLLKSTGLEPIPRLQIELKHTADIKRVMGSIMQRIESQQLVVSDIRLLSAHYGILQQAHDMLAQYDNDKRPQLGYMLMREALEYAHLDRTSPGFVQRLAYHAAATIVRLSADSRVLAEELQIYFPELSGLSAEQIEVAMPGIIEKQGLDAFADQYENYLSFVVGDGGLLAGYCLDKAALETAVFDMVYLPMDTAQGVSEAHKGMLDRRALRGARLRAHAHNVSAEGRNLVQLLRAFVLLDDNAEILLDYPEMIISLFADIINVEKQKDDTTRIKFDPTRKFRMDGMEFSTAQLEKATMRFFEIIGASCAPVAAGGAESRIGGNKNAPRYEITPPSGKKTSAD